MPPPPTVARPPSPTGSTSSVRTTGTTRTNKTVAQSRFDGDDVTVDEAREYAERPHHSWGSATKEMARIQTKIEMSRQRAESETGSCVSGISAYSGKTSYSVASMRSAVSAPSRPAKGRMGMLPLGARATSASGDRPASPTNSVSSAFSVQGSGLNSTPVKASRHSGVGGGASLRSSNLAGPAGGLSGPRRTQFNNSSTSNASAPQFELTGRGAQPPAAPLPAKFSFTGGPTALAPKAVPGGLIPRLPQKHR